jgi:hypothetical protein
VALSNPSCGSCGIPAIAAGQPSRGRASLLGWTWAVALGLS